MRQGRADAYTGTMVTRGCSSVRDPILWLVVAATTAIRALLAWRYFGFLGGDDVEVLEEAFRRAVGLAYSPWKIRSLLLPDILVAPFVRLGSTLGVHETFPLVLCATVPFAVLASVNVVLVYLIAFRWLGNRAAARTAMAIYSFHWLPLAFGSTPYPRTAAVTCVLLATLSLAGGQRHGARGLAAGCLVALAFAARYSEGLFLLPLLLVCLSAGDGRSGALRRTVGLVGGFVVGVGLTVGLYDLLTWGRAFASFIALSKLTLVERASSSRIAVQGPLFYLARLLFWLPATLLPVLPFTWRDRRLRAAWAFLLVPLVVLSLLIHKELRYLQAAIPFLAILGAAGLAAVRDRWPRAVVTVLFVLTLVSETLGVRILRGKSMAAVTAARAMAADPAVKVVALSQAWAYGDRLYFGNRVEVRDLPTPPSEADIMANIEGADRVGLYRKEVAEDRGLAAALAGHGFVPRSTLEWGRSKAVVVFARN
jgi:4-amino-4-deoxy-L-arabinose transferase-like glycosyltransferase